MNSRRCGGQPRVWAACAKAAGAGLRRPVWAETKDQLSQRLSASLASMVRYPGPGVGEGGKGM